MSGQEDVWPLSFSLLITAGGAALTLFGSIRLSMLGDLLADRLGWGEALFGAILFGAVTSLSGIVMTATSAVENHPGLAYSNAVGGIAAQTVALVVADLFYRRANLEHAAASLPNIFFGALLICLLSLAVALSFTPDVTLWSIHPGSFLLVTAYLYGMKLARELRSTPPWFPRKTRETREDVPDEQGSRRSTTRLLLDFGLMGVLVSASGWAIAQAAESVVVHTRLSDTLVGALLMGITNALPETVTSIAAVRRGALTLAMAGVLGGNAFDVLNLVVGDVAFRQGSLYHAARPEQLLLSVVGILMTAIVIAGLLRRQRQGPGNIGFESVLLLSVYVASLVLISLPE